MGSIGSAIGVGAWPRCIKIGSNGSVDYGNSIGDRCHRATWEPKNGLKSPRWRFLSRSDLSDASESITVGQTAGSVPMGLFSGQRTGRSAPQQSRDSGEYRASSKRYSGKCYRRAVAAKEPTSRAAKIAIGIGRRVPRAPRPPGFRPESERDRCGSPTFGDLASVLSLRKDSRLDSERALPCTLGRGLSGAFSDRLSLAQNRRVLWNLCDAVGQVPCELPTGSRTPQ